MRSVSLFSAALVLTGFTLLPALADPPPPPKPNLRILGVSESWHRVGAGNDGLVPAVTIQVQNNGTAPSPAFNIAVQTQVTVNGQTVWQTVGYLRAQFTPPPKPTDINFNPNCNAGQFFYFVNMTDAVRQAILQQPTRYVVDPTNQIPETNDSEVDNAAVAPGPMPPKPR